MLTMHLEDLTWLHLRFLWHELGANHLWCLSRVEWYRIGGTHFWNVLGWRCWGQRQVCCCDSACSDSPCPKNEISCVVGFYGSVFFAAIVYCVTLQGCCCYHWNQFLKGLLVPASMIVLTSQGAQKRRGIRVHYSSVFCWGFSCFHFLFSWAFLDFIDWWCD